MKQGKDAAGLLPEKPAAIDFHAPEFNVVDDLNDWAGDLRSFEPLGDVITADMRHQMERRCSRPNDFTAEESVSRNGGERPVGPEFPEEMPPLTIVSNGRTLIIDTDARRAAECSARLGAQGMECTVALTKAGPGDGSMPGRAFWGPLQADSLPVSGAFGGFTAEVIFEGDRRPLTEGFDNKAAAFDLVLDLQPRPSYAGEMLPMGYYAPGRDPSGLDGALAEIPEMRGRFVKPQFTSFLDVRCIHGLSRKRDCRRCLEICPFGAIQSVDRKIIVNSYLCQGCGACALACPTEAIRLLEPSREELLETVRQAVLAGWADRRLAPIVVISDSETDTAADSGFTPCRVEYIGHAGLELILAAIAFGAGRVIVACTLQHPACIRNEAERQVQIAGAVLQGLGMPGNTVLLAGRVDGGAVETFRNAFLPPVPEELSGAPDGRASVRRIVQHLYDQSGARQPGLEMPEGSPFGAVTVDPAACTLCMACAAACPSGALSAGRAAPQLSFIERRCHQCGLCRDACPEKAIRLAPRILCDPAAVDAPAMLREAEPFRCVVCGAPFAAQAMIERMHEKLAGHWMYAGERQLRRLRMCRTCRTRDALESKDVNAWNR
jgi:ferredoxin